MGDYFVVAAGERQSIQFVLIGAQADLRHRLTAAYIEHFYWQYSILAPLAIRGDAIVKLGLVAIAQGKKRLQQRILPAIETRPRQPSP